VLKQQHQVFVGLLAAADCAVIIAASFTAWGLRRATIEHPWWPRSWEEYPKEALVLYTVPTVMLMLRWFQLYRARRDRSIISESLEIAKACAASMMAMLALLYVFESSLFRLPYPPLDVLGRELDAGRTQLATLAVLLPIGLIAHRALFRVGLRYVRKRGRNLRHVAIIGSGRLGQIVCRTLERNNWTGIRVAYFVSHADRTRHTSCLDHPVCGGLADLEATLEASKPDAVYVALPASRANHLGDVLMRLDKFAVDVRIVPDINPRYLPQNMAVSELDGMPILSYRENPHSGLGGVSKRILDVLGALAALVLFSPVMLVAWALIRSEGPGPVIFKQRRVSLGGQEFWIYKFRTMFHVEDEAGAGAPKQAAWTERDDPRVTPIGRWLRRTSVDELPQLLNVLAGDMSLVGPRPERPELIQRFREDWRGYMMRQHVKAGMTGWAQVNGLRGQTSLRKRLQYDLFYVKNWSLGFDLKILVLTIFRGFIHRNAH
jgi:Undecaprenyl-phosphate glucose phosphotransferase